MKVYKKILTMILVLVAFALAGCTSFKQLPDGTYFGITTVKDDLDRSASRVGHYRYLGKNPDGSAKYEEIKGDVAVGPTVAGQALIGASGGVLSAVIQGEAAKKVAKTTSTCGGSGCSGGSTVVVNAVSQAVSQNEVSVSSSVGTCGAACAD